jgi:hypothetical protein
MKTALPAANSTDGTHHWLILIATTCRTASSSTSARWRCAVA